MSPWPRRACSAVWRGRGSIEGQSVTHRQTSNLDDDVRASNFFFGLLKVQTMAQSRSVTHHVNHLNFYFDHLTFIKCDFYQTSTVHDKTPQIGLFEWK